MDKWFYQIFLKIKNNRILASIIAVFVIAGLGFTASQITFEEDITKLLPATAETRELQKILQSVSFSDKIIVNIKREKDAPTSSITKYATTFLDTLNNQAGDYIMNVQGKVDTEGIGTTLQFVYDNLPLFLTNDDYLLIAQKLAKDSITKITQNNYRTLISPTGIIARKTILKDPLGLSFIALKKLQRLGVGDDFKLKDGFVISKDENNVLLFITPKYPSSDAANNEDFSDILYAIQDQINIDFKGRATSEYFGGALIAVANAKQIKNDIQVTIGIALTILMGIFIVFYRNLLVPFILFTPTIIGALLSVAVLYLIRNEISAISLGIGSVLLGVTLDYSLHILTHIRNHEGTASLYKEIAKPILMSALTTALAFLCLLFIDSQALQDLGIFAAVSVLGASVVALLFIPQVYRGKADKTRKQTLIDRISKYPFHKNKVAIAVITALFLMSCFTYQKVGFNKDLATLNFEPEEITKAKKNLALLTNIEAKSMYAVAHSSDTQQLLKANDGIYKTLKRLAENEEILSYNSLGALMQADEKQLNSIKKWHSFWNGNRKAEVKNNLIESGAQLGFKPTTFNSFYTLLDAEFKSLNASDFEALSFIHLEDFLSKREDLSTITSIIKLESHQIETVKKAFTDRDNVVLIDRNELNETLLGSLKSDFNKLIGYSLAIVIILLLLYYKSLSLTIVTVLPVFLTWVITIGIMGFFGVEFNIFNIIISSFIFGLGIDYAIFITNGLLHKLRTGHETMATHKTSIILSVLTTVLGVGVLIFAKHPALYTISVVSIIGIFAAMLLAFTIQPLLFNLFIGSKTKRPNHLRYFIHSFLSFTYFGVGAFVLSILGVVLIPILPFSKKIKMPWFHKAISTLMKSVLYSNPFIKKIVLNPHNESFKKPAFLIANHTSFLDILAIGMLTPKLIFLVNDWVYNSPIFGRAVKLAGFYPVSKGIDEAMAHLQPKIKQGYSLIAFPEGTRSKTNKVRRFHKGAFFLAEKLELDIIPVLIHGNSEVNPKGSFIIRDGSITIKILGRIKCDTNQFGESYSKKTKLTGAHFRNEFTALRTTIEAETYFKKTLLEEYRYKGSTVYKAVQKDLNKHLSIYKTCVDLLPKDASLLHFTEDYGQLDFLLVLDSALRRVISIHEEIPIVELLNESFLSHTERKVSFHNKTEHISETEKQNITTIIYCNKAMTKDVLASSEFSKLNLLVVLKQPNEIPVPQGFSILYQVKNLSIFKKKELSNDQ